MDVGAYDLPSHEWGGASSLTEKLLAYATGAAPSKADQPEIETIVRHIRDRSYGFKSLIHGVVRSQLFQSK